MEELLFKYKYLKRAIRRLSRMSGHIRNSPERVYSNFDRDLHIYLLVHAYRLLWEFISIYLEVFEDVIANSPVACFREVFSLEIVTPDETTKLLKLIDLCNNTTNINNNKLDNYIFSKIPEYSELLEKVFSTLRDRLYSNLILYNN